MSLIQKRLFLIFLAIFVFISFLEIIFRAAYWGDYYWRVRHETQTAQQKILCIGNSFTLGAGAAPEESYPAHLQRFLDSKFGNKKFQVINLGRGAFNTTLILERLEEWLKNYHPKFVLLQTGEPNYWNLYGYDSYRGVRSHFLLKLLRDYSATFRYFQYLVQMKELERTAKEDFVWTGDSIFVNSFYAQDFLTLKNLSLDCLTSESNLAQREKLLQSEAFLNLNSHIEKAKEIAKKYPKEFSPARLLYGLKLSCSQDYEAAEPYLKKMIELEPSKKFGYLYATNASLYAPTIAKERAKIMRRQFMDFLNQNYSDYIDIVREDAQQFVGRWVESDIKKMLGLIKKYGANPVLINYPPPPEGNQRPVDALLRNFAYKNKTQFVDVEKFFLDFWQNPKNQKKDFHENRASGLSEHLNGAGYKLMAQQIYESLLPVTEIKEP